MLKLSNTFLLTLWIISASAQQKITPQEYIEKYKDYAVIEMHRAGVPASITLSQGLLESSNGNSRLATEAMNHFGIKCKSTWTGGVIYANDDAPDECFRAYKSVLESYRDHSNFLRDNWRYSELFDLRISDYKGWAKGLRKAGYATNPDYHNILINIIERYELYKYDSAPIPNSGDGLVVYQNNIPAVYLTEGQTVKTLAESNDLKAHHIYKFNDLPKGSEVKEGDLLYLKPKKRKGSAEFHTVQPGESMYLISQQYGIKLKHLYKKNHLERGLEPEVGEKLYMQHKRDKEDTVSIQDEASAAKNEIIRNNFINPYTSDFEKAPPIQKVVMDNPEFYVVKAGDNIYRISETFHVLEEDLLRWNQLTSMTLQVGQKLYLSEEAASKFIKKSEPRKVIINEEKEIIEIEDDPVLPDQNEGVKYHVVQTGETVYRICKMYNITEAELKKMNGMNTVTIYVGQKLKIKE
jgi:LysM repeat protein